jgi:indolepyruvate ferredoxin oxidoreductase alpha subunit
VKGLDVITEALRRAADRFYAVPGYPVTDLADMLGAESCISEKVALEYALGDSLSGRRATVIVKNVGLNSCADPLVNATTQGLRAGLVVVAGDDIEVKGSQNAQDSRYYGELAQVPVLEPGGEGTGPAIEEAFRASEAFSRVALLRLTPAALETEVPADYERRKEGHGRLASPELTMKGRAMEADRLAARMFAWSRASHLNHRAKGVPRIGPAPGEGSRYLTVYPPPAPAEALLSTDEYGRPFVREHRLLAPPPDPGEPETMQARGFARTFCPGCPFKPVLELMKEQGMKAVCDIGCSLFAKNPPYEVGIASYGLGSSVAVAARSTGVALTGDFALLHSGINALIDVHEKELPLLVVVLKNCRMGMTGGQPAPDPVKYLAWASPVVVSASDHEGIAAALSRSGCLNVVIVEGVCPEGERHGTVEY